MDGYNVIFKWKLLSKFIYNMDLARSKLINILANYQGYIGEDLAVVFDSASKTNIGGLEDVAPNIRVVYAPSEQGADLFIEKMVSTSKKPEDITVVTGDLLERTAVGSFGAYTITPERFEKEVIKTIEGRSKI